MSRDIGQAMFRSLGCHPLALQGSRERSGAVWLLASMMAREWNIAMYQGLERRESVVFVSGFNEEGVPESAWREFARMDQHTLDDWMTHARKVLSRMERYMAYMYLMDNRFNEKVLNKIEDVYADSAETRREYG